MNKACKNCRWWEEGWSFKLNENKCVKIGKSIGIKHDIYPLKNFGCIHFKPKKKMTKFEEKCMKKVEKNFGDVLAQMSKD